MSKSLETKVVAAYADGSPVDVIAESYGISSTEVLTVLHTYKTSSRTKRAFSEGFKRMIAERDLCGVPRVDISKELDININTVKKSCEAFGQTFKERAASENLFTRIEGFHTKDHCPTCKSTHYNAVDENTHYCFDCGMEFVHGDTYVLQMHWEYVD